MPLTVTFFDRDLMERMTTVFPRTVKLDFCIDVPSFGDSLKDENANPTEACVYKSCASCETAFSGSECRVVSCPRCRSNFHARCAATCFRKQETSLIPSQNGECPVCDQSVLWSEFVRSAVLFNESVAKADSSSEDESSAEEEDSEKSVIDLESDESSPVTQKSPIVSSVVSQGSLRARLFKKTGNSDLFKI